MIDKQCSKCNVVKSASAYSKDSQKSDGFRSNCKDEIDSLKAAINYLTGGDLS